MSSRPVVQEPSSFKSVRNSCRRLWRQLDSLLLAGESMATQKLSHLDAQQAALTKEKLRLEAMRQSAVKLWEKVEHDRRKAEEETQRARAEREAAERMSTKLHSQLADLKQVQTQMAAEVARIDEVIVEFKKLARDVLTSVQSQKSDGLSSLESKLLDGEARLNLLKIEMQSNMHVSDKFRSSIMEREASSDTIQVNPSKEPTSHAFEMCQDNTSGEMANASSQCKGASEALVSKLKRGYSDTFDKPLQHLHGTQVEMAFRPAKVMRGQIFSNSDSCPTDFHQDSLRKKSLLPSGIRAAADPSTSAQENPFSLRGSQVQEEYRPPPLVPDNQQTAKYGESMNSELMVVVKEEPLELGPSHCEKAYFEVFCNGTVQSDFHGNVKVEFLEAEEDELDMMPLTERLKLLRQSTCLKNNTLKCENLSRKFAMGSLKKMARHAGWRPSFSGKSGFCKGAKWYKIPIETALQEDAPGLLEKLQEKDLMEGLDIYGDVAEEVESQQNDFEDLENVVNKLWGSSSGLFKQSHIIRQQSTGVHCKPSYCLACLESLIEQTRSLKQHKWPVEWGWCRQLQAFLFVFDKHNRIVLERPEYGHATYFFELVQTLPLTWQVSRLIRVMSATTVGRTALLDNRPLELGKDLTNCEARILEDYGWAPNTGLGSFLNFYDRVVHDVKDDNYTDWRHKIGKCLMDGYDRGRIAIHSVPQKLQCIQGHEIKVDLDLATETPNKDIKAEQKD